MKLRTLLTAALATVCSGCSPLTPQQKTMPTVPFYQPLIMQQNAEQHFDFRFKGKPDRERYDILVAVKTPKKPTGNPDIDDRYLYNEWDRDGDLKFKIKLVYYPDNGTPFTVPLYDSWTKDIPYSDYKDAAFVGKLTATSLADPEFYYRKFRLVFTKDSKNIWAAEFVNKHHRGHYRVSITPINLPPKHELFGFTVSVQQHYSGK